MTLLDRYLIKQFSKNLLLIVATLVSIYFLVDFFERIDNFVDAKMPMSLAARYFLLKIPFMLDMLQPVCILLAGVITLGLLNHNNEFMALKAGGISTFRITLPLLISAVIVTFAALFIAEWVLPPTFSETERIWNEEVHHKIPKGILRKGRIYFRGEKGIYSFVQSSEKNIFTKFEYIQINQNFEPVFQLTADRANWENGTWTFYNGQTKKPISLFDNTYSIELFEEHSLKLRETPDDFFAPSFKANERSISTLYVKSKEDTPLQATATIDLHSRLSFIFLGIPLIFIGIPVILIVHQKWGRDLTFAIPISCGLAFAAWSWWSTSQSMAKAAYLPPFAAAWIMHLIICPLGFWLLKRQE